jgi:hypothetical protein
MAAWIGGGAAWISGADNGRRRRRGRPGSAEARRGSAAAQPRPAALTTAGGGGKGERRWAAATFGWAEARVVGRKGGLLGGRDWWVGRNGGRGGRFTSDRKK